jgi:hypothetical protein
MYMRYRDGYLAENGGVNDQPNGYMNAMMLLDQMFKKAEAQKLANMKVRNQAKKGSHGPRR